MFGLSLCNHVDEKYKEEKANDVQADFTPMAILDLSGIWVLVFPFTVKNGP